MCWSNNRRDPHLLHRQSAYIRVLMNVRVGVLSMLVLLSLLLFYSFLMRTFYAGAWIHFCQSRRQWAIESQYSWAQGLVLIMGARGWRFWVSKSGFWQHELLHLLLDGITFFFQTSSLSLGRYNRCGKRHWTLLMRHWKFIDTLLCTLLFARVQGG